jgi:hypothetical protein
MVARIDDVRVLAGEENGKPGQRARDGAEEERGRGPAQVPLLLSTVAARALDRIAPMGPTAATNAAPRPVGADNPVTSCDLHVFVDEAAEPVSS